jgi:hypothetical protein
MTLTETKEITSGVPNGPSKAEALDASKHFLSTELSDVIVEVESRGITYPAHRFVLSSKYLKY